NQGKYTVTLTITTASGCTETYAMEEAVKVGTKPTTAFSLNKDIVCAKDGVQFTDESTDADEWQWDFGDGTKSRAKNPLHTFETIGTVEVSLQAFNSGCEGDIVKKTVTIKAPIAAFSYRPTTCDDPLTYTFKNATNDGGIPILTWQWTITNGAGYTATYNVETPPAHTFPAFGTYTVSLYASNGECDYTATQNVRIAEHKPDFQAAVRAGCKPFTAVLTPSDLGDPLIKAYTWDFGDGTTTTTTGPASHTYAVPGDYDVTLVTTDVYDCDAVSVPKPKYIRVNGPAAKFSSTTNQGCVGMTTTFNDETVTDGQNPIVSWEWDFGDRTRQIFTAPPFQHTYTKVARYDVKLIVQDAAGCKDSIGYDNFIRTSDFKMEWSGTRQTCPGANTQFSSVSNTRNYTSFWDFGNGATSTSNTPSYAYPDTGTYSIKLVITDTLGCKDSLTKLDYTRVYRPEASFTANNFATYCIPFEAHFTNTSTYYTGSSWNLGIGTSTQTNPVSYYTNTGTYNIKLTVTSPGGCKDDTTQVLHVFDAKDGKLTYGPTTFSCRPLQVNFNAFSDLKGSFVWDFGDGTVVDTTVNTLSHIYDNVGDFVPKIILREPSGCLVSITGSTPVQVVGAKIKFGIDKRLFCDSGLLTIFDSTAVRGPNQDYTWEFGDGSISKAPNPGTHYYQKPGIYPLKLTVKTGNGCVDSLAIRPGIKVSETPVITINGDSVICANDFVKSAGVFQSRDTSFIRWAWQFPNGTTSAVQTPPDQQFNTAGTFPINSIATNSDGCADTAIKRVLVHPLPTSTLPSAITMQAGYPVNLSGTYSSNVASYTWRPATGLSCTTCPNPIASPKFSTKYIVRYVDSNNCVNTNAVQVIVICKNANVFIPNTFSPNGDGSNDVFYVRGRGLDRVKSLRIFNRWGEVVFEKKDFAVNDASVGWDGRYKGSKPKPDVYIYQVEVFCENSEIIRFDGNVALIQ
ncbi:MAG TPA: PKD domain-containing protein, partial [Niastella sp.]|nr:PKD domain-containing protein [Niastella sp.]